MGLFCKAGEQIRGYFVIAHGERIAIAVPSSPPRVVACGDTHIRVSELTTHNAECFKDASRTFGGTVLWLHAKFGHRGHSFRLIDIIKTAIDNR